MEHKSETVAVQVERQPHCKVILRTKAMPSLVEGARKIAVKKVAKQVSVPGFRKGKAPEKMILQSFSGAVDEEWQKAIADTAFRDTQALVHLPILNGNSRVVFDMEKHSLEGAEMTFAFETEPVIPEIKYEEIVLHPPKKETVSDKQVMETLGRIQEHFGTVNQIKDRPVQEGDTVRLDVNLVDGETMTPVFNNHRFEVKKGGMAQWMFDLVVGMQIGEGKDGVSKVDADASEEEKKSFEPKNVRVTLIAIEEMILPELDDALAQKLGVPTMDEAKERLKGLLQKKADEAHQRALRDQVSERLLDDFPFDVPATLVQREEAHRLQTSLKNPQFKARWNAMSEEEKTAEKEAIKTESERAIRLFYLCRKISEQHNIGVSPADLNPGVENTLDAMFADPYLFNAKPGSEEEAILHSRIMLGKAQDYVISKAKLEEKKVPAKKAAAKKPAEKKATEKKPAAKKPAAKKESAKKAPAKKKST